MYSHPAFAKSNDNIADKCKTCTNMINNVKEASSIHFIEGVSRNNSVNLFVLTGVLKKYTIIYIYMHLETEQYHLYLCYTKEILSFRALQKLLSQTSVEETQSGKRKTLVIMQLGMGIY